MKSASVHVLRSEKNPLVSVIIPAHNYGRYISEAIDSVLAQTYPRIELIVIDDGSTDNTRDVVKKYPQIKYVYQKNAGVANAMNHGVLISKGEFFICLGADDKLHPTYISRCVAEILKDKRVGFVWTAAQAFGQTEVIGYRHVLSPRILHHRFSIYRDPGGQTGAALIRREAFDEVGGYDESLPAYEDWDLVIRFYKRNWKGKPIFEPLHFYRFHENQRTSSTRKAPLHRYLENKHPFMKIYAPLVRIFEFAVLWVKRPQIGLIRLWNKIIPRFFSYEKLVEPPTNAQHSMINERKVLSLLVEGCILDRGCGMGRWGYLIGKRKQYSIVGFDINKSYLQKTKKVKSYSGLVLADLSSPPFRDKLFDTSLAIEALEHVPKEKGQVFVNELKRITRKRIILSTPSNFLFAYHGDGHPETHKSGWTKNELEAMGFNCTTINPHVYQQGSWLLCTYNFNP